MVFCSAPFLQREYCLSVKIAIQVKDIYEIAMDRRPYSLFYKFSLKSKRAFLDPRLIHIVSYFPSKVPKYERSPIIYILHIHKPPQDNPLPREHHALIAMDEIEVLQGVRWPTFFRKTQSFVLCHLCNIFRNHKSLTVGFINCKANPLPIWEGPLRLQNGFYEPAY